MNWLFEKDWSWTELHAGETMLWDVDLEAMDDTIEYMDTSIRRIPVTTTTTSDETDLSFKCMTTSMTGKTVKKHYV